MTLILTTWKGPISWWGPQNVSLSTSTLQGTKHIQPLFLQGLPTPGNVDVWKRNFYNLLEVGPRELPYPWWTAPLSTKLLSITMSHHWFFLLHLPTFRWPSFLMEPTFCSPIFWISWLVSIPAALMQVLITPPCTPDGLLKCIPLSSFYPISSSPQQPHKLKRQLWSWNPHDGNYLRVPAPENLQQDALSRFVPSLPLHLVFLPILPSLCCTTSQTATVLNYLHILEWDMLYLALYPCYYCTYKTQGVLEKNADSDSRGLA